MYYHNQKLLKFDCCGPLKYVVVLSKIREVTVLENKILVFKYINRNNKKIYTFTTLDPLYIVLVLSKIG